MEQETIKAATENFNLPHDVVTLPTGGIFYKSKKKSVKVGYLTAADENFLINALTGDKDNIVMTLLRSKLYEHDLRPEELMDGDVEAILLFLRNTSFGPEYNMSLVDPKNGKKFDTSIMLDELNIKKSEVNPNEDGHFVTKLPRSGASVKLRPMTFAETVEIEKMVSQYPAGRVAPTVTWRLQKQIVELDGSTDKGTIAMFIDTMPIMDSKYIRKFINNNQPSLDLTKSVIAPSGELVSLEITFGVEFFRPFF